MTKETIYIDAVTKLNEQDAVIKELATALRAICNAYYNDDYDLCYSRIEDTDDVLDKYEEVK
jgi:hypothetical protein